MDGIAFLAGFALGTTIACVLGLFIGQVAVSRLDSHETAEALLTLALGAALLMLGVRARGGARRPWPRRAAAGWDHGGTSNVRPAAAFSLAGLLGFGGPKRLLLTLLAMASVNEVGEGDLEDVTLVVLYIAVATVLVSVLVGIVIVAGGRAAIILERAESWLTTHAAGLRVWLSLGLGAALIVDALLRLFA